MTLFARTALPGLLATMAALTAAGQQPELTPAILAKGQFRSASFVVW